MSKISRIRLLKLALNNRGATLVEFAFVAPVLCIVVLGFLEFAHWQYVRSTAVGAIEEVARAAGVGGTTVNPRLGEIKAESIIKTVASTATFAWSKKSYYQYSGVGKPEKLTNDKDDDGQYDKGDCWEDSTPNGRFDNEQGSEGIGGADDVVVYELIVRYDPLVRLSGLVPGVPDARSTKVSTMVKRQPFAAQATPVIKC